MRNWLGVAILSSLLWFLVETIGGLAFLVCGIRLWTYHTAPLFWNITSPFVWLILFLGMPPFIIAFRRWEHARGWSGPRLAVYRGLYLMIVGPVMEVFVNVYVFQAMLGQPLFLYEVLPTFGGSGSLLSPLYYLALYPHYPLTEALLWKPFSSSAVGTA